MISDNTIHLGDGVADAVKTSTNREVAELLTELISVISAYLKGKIEKIPDVIEQLLSNPATKQEISTLWSKHLFEDGLVQKGYCGLSDKLIIHNFHQDGYLTGLHVGYMLAMMALVDNDADENLILSVRDAIRPNLFGHSYDNADEFTGLYKDEKYNWVETCKNEKNPNRE